MPRLSITFLLAVLTGASIVLVAALARKPESTTPSSARELVAGIWISEQVTMAELIDLKSQGFKSIIDLRPDGEVKDQPSSVAVERAAKENGLAFAYVPVPHGDISSAQVDALAVSLGNVDRPVLLYCRSGRRAARTWALSEASQRSGLGAEAIHAALVSAGQPAHDLAPEISARIAARQPLP